MRYWRPTARIREAILRFLQRPQAGPQPPVAHAWSASAAGPTLHAGRSRQLTKSGANSRHPNTQEHNGVVRHSSSASQQLSRRQDRQLASPGPSHTKGIEPVLSPSDPPELELDAATVPPSVLAVSSSPVVAAPVATPLVPVPPPAPDEDDAALDVPAISLPVLPCSASPPKDAVTEHPPSVTSSSSSSGGPLTVRGIRLGPSL